MSSSSVSSSSSSSASASLSRSFVGRGETTCVVEPGCDLKNPSVGRFRILNPDVDPVETERDSQRELKVVQRYISKMSYVDANQDHWPVVSIDPSNTCQIPIASLSDETKSNCLLVNEDKKNPATVLLYSMPKLHYRSNIISGIRDMKESKENFTPFDWCYTIALRLLRHIHTLTSVCDIFPTQIRYADIMFKDRTHPVMTNLLDTSVVLPKPPIDSGSFSILHSSSSSSAVTRSSSSSSSSVIEASRPSYTLMNASDPVVNPRTHEEYDSWVDAEFSSFAIRRQYPFHAESAPEWIFSRYSVLVPSLRPLYNYYSWWDYAGMLATSRDYLEDLEENKKGDIVERKYSKMLIEKDSRPASFKFQHALLDLTYLYDKEFLNLWPLDLSYAKTMYNIYKVDASNPEQRLSHDYHSNYENVKILLSQQQSFQWALVVMNLCTEPASPLKPWNLWKPDSKEAPPSMIELAAQLKLLVLLSWALCPLLRNHPSSSRPSTYRKNIGELLTLDEDLFGLTRKWASVSVAHHGEFDRVGMIAEFFELMHPFFHYSALQMFAIPIGSY